MMRSKQSRRRVPIARSQKALALGARGGVARRRVPSPPNTPAKVGAVDRVPVMDQKARMLAIGDRLDEALSGQIALGFWVTPAWTTLRRSRERTTKTYWTRNLAVTRTKKSQAQV